MESGLVYTRPDGVHCRDEDISRPSQFRQFVKGYVTRVIAKIAVSHVRGRGDSGAEPVWQVVIPIGRTAAAEVEHAVLDQLAHRQDA